MILLTVAKTIALEKLISLIVQESKKQLLKNIFHKAYSIFNWVKIEKRILQIVSIVNLKVPLKNKLFNKRTPNIKRVHLDKKMITI
jgi:hypothetical protein